MVYPNNEVLGCQKKKEQKRSKCNIQDTLLSKKVKYRSVCKGKIFCVRNMENKLGEEI